MSDKKAKLLIIVGALVLMLSGFGLYKLFDYQGYGQKSENKLVNYNVKDYVEVNPVVYNNYNDVYSSIDVTKVTIKGLDKDLTLPFENSQKELIGYIDKYYSDIKKYNDYSSNNIAITSVETKINSTILSILYRLDFNFERVGEKNYFITSNIDLKTNKLLTNDDLLTKYNYTRKYIAEKLFNDEILIGNSEVVVDKETNISLAKNDIERRKNAYIDGIVANFDNIIKLYIENGSLTLIYNTKDLKGLFYEGNFDTQIKLKYLK